MKSKKKYRCIKSFAVPFFDDDGHRIDGKQIVVLKDTVFNMTGSNLIGGEIHLEEASTGNWIEITNERFKECFE